MKKILITTGGTGGHVIPAKIIKEHLKDDFNVLYSTDERGHKYLTSDTLKTIIIDTPKFNSFIYMPFRLMKVIFLIFKAVIFLKKEKIEKVISIGGYMSLPIIIAAKISKLSIILFEPNMVLGRGNKFFLNFSKKIFCYSDKLSNFPKKHLHKIELINPLVFKSFYEKKQINKSDGKFCFLISGGSQGAEFFDEFMKEIMADIANNFSIKIIQQTTVKNIANLKKFYDAKNIENKIFNFEEKFIDLINMSDLCITRAGATSLAEIAHLNKPFIAVPLPSSKDDHQMSNAKFYEEKKCCWVLDQRNIKKEEMFSMLINILKDKNDLIEKKLNLVKLNSNNSWNDINQKLIKIVNEN